MTGAGWAFARTLVDELARQGLTDAVLAPGSRSAPLALALAEHPAVRVHVHLDERSASFFALGLGLASGRPAAVLCTSGTAAANFHPAVLEASHARVPLLVLTADRPPQLRDTGAGQTVDQTRLYGTAVRWFADPGVAREGPDASAWWRSLAARAWAEAAGRPAGPVHLNLPFAEPLVPASLDAPAEPGRPDGQPWTSGTAAWPAPRAEDVDALARLAGGARRGLVVAGWGAGTRPQALDAFVAATGWPVLADPLSNLRAGPSVVSTYGALLAAPGFAATHRPDLVLRLGATPTGKRVPAWLGAEVPQVLVDPDGAWLDPRRAAVRRVVADPSALLEALAGAVPAPGPGDWPAAWAHAERVARRTIDELLDGLQEPFEGRLARDLADHLPDGATLVAGSSMPVRDLEAYARPRSGLRWLSNRGVSGIDGFVATALGVAAAGDGPVAALCGDLTFLHDASSVLGAAGRAPVTLVVADNDGGGIFSFLPQAGLPRHFETLFGTPHGLDLTRVADAAGLGWRRLTKADDLPPALDEALASGETRVLLVPSERAANVRIHQEVDQAVAAALAAAATL